MEAWDESSLMVKVGGLEYMYWRLHMCVLHVGHVFVSS